jgi:biopolymer transport protein ExbD
LQDDEPTGKTAGPEVHAVKILRITIGSAKDGQVSSITVGNAKLFNGPLDGARIRQLDRRLKDAFAIDGTFDRLLLRIGKSLDYGEALRLLETCVQNKMADGKPANRMQFENLGDPEEAIETSFKVSISGADDPIDPRGFGESLDVNVTTQGDVIVSGQPKNPEEYLAKEARIAILKLKAENKKVKLGEDELPTIIVVRADPKTPFYLVNKLLTQCQKNGFRRIDLRPANPGKESDE